jgi:hypothetical protein
LESAACHTRHVESPEREDETDDGRQFSAIGGDVDTLDSQAGQSWPKRLSDRASSKPQQPFNRVPNEAGDSQYNAGYQCECTADDRNTRTRSYVRIGWSWIEAED